MGDMQELYAHELMQERYRLTVEALQRCAEKDVDEETIRTLCRETGVNVKDVIVEKRNAA